MLNEIKYITHDLVNKYTILISKIENPKEIDRPIKRDAILPVVERIGELLKDLSICVQKSEFHSPSFEVLNLHEFSVLIKKCIDKFSFLYRDCHIQFPNSINDKEALIKLDKKLLYQVLENVIENSANSKSTVVAFELSQSHDTLTLSIEDNGIGGPQIKKAERILPHGIGTRIIYDNLEIMNAKVTCSKTKNNSFIVLIHFPISKNPISPP